jgi:hypothetical protein
LGLSVDLLAFADVILEPFPLFRFRLGPATRSLLFKTTDWKSAAAPIYNNLRDLREASSEVS